MKKLIYIIGTIFVLSLASLPVVAQKESKEPEIKGVSQERGEFEEVELGKKPPKDQKIKLEKILDNDDAKALEKEAKGVDQERGEFEEAELGKKPPKVPKIKLEKILDNEDSKALEKETQGVETERGALEELTFGKKPPKIPKVKLKVADEVGGGEW